MEGLLKLAGQSGMSPQQAQTTTGGLLNLLQSKMDPNKFDQQVAQNLPGAQDVMTAQQQQQSPSDSASGGMGGLLGGAMSSAMGGGKPNNVAALLASLAGQGVNPKMVQTFLPLFAGYVKSQCGIDVGSMLGLPAASSAAGAGASTGSGAAGSGMGGLPGNLGGLASSFGFGKK